MSSPVIDLLGGYFAEDLIDERPVMRTSLDNGPAEARVRIRGEFRALLSDRGLTHDDFFKQSAAWFGDDTAMYQAFQDAYRFFFDEEPPAPAG